MDARGARQRRRGGIRRKEGTTKKHIYVKSGVVVVGWEIVLRADTWGGFVASGRQWGKKDHREGNTARRILMASRQTDEDRQAGVRAGR